jgi:hypothetical protein
MKRIVSLTVLSLCLCAPSLLMAQGTYNHAEVGVFADYFRLSPSHPVSNFVGIGGRAGFNVSSNTMIEAELNYDFERNFTTTTSTGGTSTFVRSRLRPITGLFGPKFQFGGSGPFRVFVTGKVGFINFSSSTSGIGSGVGNIGNTIANGTNSFAAYPGGGIEGFWGPFGLRLDVGDEIYINHGTFNNLRVTFGPHIRF